MTTHPETSLMGLARLMRMALAGQDLSPIGERLLARSRDCPDDANALMDLSIVLQLRGNREAGLAVRDLAVRTRPLYHLPGLGLRLLVLLGPGDLMANSPVECLLEDSDVALDLLYLAPDRPFPDSVPEHDALFVAVAESDANLPLLARLADWLRDWPRPVLNRPERIAQLSRDGVCELLRGVPGMVLPQSVRVARSDLDRLAQGQTTVFARLGEGDFPVIVRPIDSHAGHGLDKLDDADMLAAYLRTVDAEEFYLARFVDYRGADGLFRKYRVILIDGQPYACHMAISTHWMIHYLNAGMADDAAKRAEEAQFMADFDTGFARRHAEVFAAIQARTGLDYVGIDCGETASGDLLMFEVDSCMIVHAMDSLELFPYKPATMQKLFAAFRALLARSVG